MSRLSGIVASLVKEKYQSLPECKVDFKTPFPRLDFVANIQSALQKQLPNLSAPDAESQVKRLLVDNNIDLPASQTLPRLLDKLSSVYLEPQCVGPTWIVHHPECLSPLSKSFIHPATKQRISARAELFIQGREYINTYEEENSPSEQRRKFVEQLRYQEDGGNEDIDEDYIEALKWGMPPTGGWGCGIDRLVMLFSGTERIGDVLPFGNLRNIVSLGDGRRERRRVA
ncbi:MAG: hypothetical protein Q9190_007630 [Brigantiaea leucoxantha]